MDRQNIKRWLFRLGVLLFLLGLVTGFALPALANPRMGLSSHLEGVLNGIVLIVLGFLWTELRLSRFASTAGFVLFIYGTYVNWASTLLAAVFGTGHMTPLAAPGREGTALQEGIVNFGFISLSFAMVIGCALVLWGLRGKAAEAESHA